MPSEPERKISVTPEESQEYTPFVVVMISLVRGGKTKVLCDPVSDPSRSEDREGRGGKTGADFAALTDLVIAPILSSRA